MRTNHLYPQQTLNKQLYTTNYWAKRKKGMVFMVFSFQHYLSFVERFVENMLSRKYLMFNTSFIIFNNSTKIRGVLSVIFMNRTHPPTSKNVMLMLQYLFTTVRQRQANKQARGHSTKGGCSSIELQDNDTTFLFCPVQSLEDGGTKPSCPV